MRPLQDLALVDVLFAYIVQLLIHQFDHMEMVEDMHRIRAIFVYWRDESGREVSGNIPDVNLFLSLFQNRAKASAALP